MYMSGKKGEGWLTIIKDSFELRTTLKKSKEGKILAASNGTYKDKHNNN